MKEHPFTETGPSSKPEAASEADSAFSRIYCRYYPEIRSFFARRGFSPDESLDLAQDTLLQVYRSLGNFRGEASERTWILAIAANVYSNHLRRRAAHMRAGREIPLEDTWELSQGHSAFSSTAVDPLGSSIISERDRLARKAIVQLPLRMRQAVALRYVQNLKYHEVAVLLGISLDTVKALLYQAKRRLKEVLDRDFSALEDAKESEE